MVAKRTLATLNSRHDVSSRKELRTQRKRIGSRKWQKKGFDLEQVFKERFAECAPQTLQERKLSRHDTRLCIYMT
jgi:hypothetical protein